jgi:riboflavin kinase/FMN adenylyltransferase
MDVVNSLKQFADPKKPIALTIGSFDGVHLGHKALFQQVVTAAHEIKGKSVILTFRNHPSEVLRPAHPTPLICSIQHKIKLLKESHADTLVLLDFTPEIAQQTPEEFLQDVRKRIPFSHLILGDDATIGKDRQGNRAYLQGLSRQWPFHLEYLSHYHIDGMKVSSSKIRQYIHKGNFSEAEMHLGRKYSIYDTVIRGHRMGKKIGFPTLNLDVKGLCLPPYGVYAVRMLYEKQLFSGVANLGIAPTTRQDISPLLEIYVFDFEKDLYGSPVEIFFEKYMRPEMKFNSIEALKEQIRIDVAEAKRTLQY